MATADQYETQIDAIKTAALAIAGYGSTGTSGTTSASPVVATSTRKHNARVVPGAGANTIKSALRQGAWGIGILEDDHAVIDAESAVMVLDHTDFVFVVARVKK
jgi:DUF1009 family protein